jgi:ferredoxin-nitrate reductase
MAAGGYSTRNAVEDIWGERIPYEHEWPSRCDEHRTDEPDHWVQSACVMCRYGIERLPPGD